MFTFYSNLTLTERAPRCVFIVFGTLVLDHNLSFHEAASFQLPFAVKDFFLQRHILAFQELLLSVCTFRVIVLENRILFFRS